MRRGTYRQVEQIFVLCTTSVTYSEKIILFMIWMFDKRREFLVQEYIPEFEAMNHEDLLGFQQHKEDEHVTNIRKINQINQRTGIQRPMINLFYAIQPSRSGMSHKIPIKIKWFEITWHRK